MKGKRSVLGIVPLVTVLTLWQFASQGGIVSQAFLPSVSSIITTLADLLVNPGLYKIPVNVTFTIERTFLGYLLSIAIAVPIGLVIGLNRRLYKILEPTIEMFRPLPSVALIPFFILLFGINNVMYVLFIAYGCTWPILLNTVDGVRDIDPMFFEVARSLKIKANSVVVKITLPAATPFIISGMRISLLLALLLAITIEMVSGFNGLGWSTLYAEQTANVRVLYAEIFIIASLGFVFNVMFVRLERRFVGWYNDRARQT